MGKRIILNLSAIEQSSLEEIVNHSPIPYLRERASAVLKVSSGYSCHWVASKGLLQHRRVHTVTSWIKRYQEEGVLGLKNKSGRGRKPSFSPC